jgi:CHAT domain-containing protein
MSAGNKSGDSALSGLARAILYAGSRSLLVSHWYVDSIATVTLVTGAFRELPRGHGDVGPAEAVQRAMASLVTGGGRLAHPSRWAPFIVVGEGRR